MTQKSKNNLNNSSKKNIQVVQNTGNYNEQTLYDNHPLILVTISLDKKIISVNRNGAKELGYEVSELIGEQITKLFISAEAERLDKQISNVLMQPGKQSSHEMLMLRKNNQQFWVRETIYTINSDETIQEIYFVCDNITFQKNAEVNAKNLAESLQSMLDASPLGVFVFSQDENDELILISTNQSAVNILKINVYKLISKPISEIFPSLDKNFIEKEFLKVIKSGNALLNQVIDYKDDLFSGIYEYSIIKLSEKNIAIFFTEITEKQKALASLQQSELKFKTLFESANDAIFLMKEDVFIDCNEKTTEIFVGSKAQIIGKKPYQFSPEFQPDGHLSSTKAKEKITLAFSGTPQSFEWLHLKLDGTPFFAEVSLKRVDLQGESYLQAIVRDITERKKSEKIITGQKRELDTLMSNLPGMAYRCANNLNWTMEFVSDGCYMLTGYRKDELINDKVVSYASIIHKEDQLLVFETVQNAVNNHEPFTLLYRIITWQGLEKWVWEKGRAIYDEHGNVICIEGFVTDITERKLAEERIVILAQTLKSVSESVCITNLRDKIIFINKSFSRIYGYSSNEIIGKPITIVRSSNNDHLLVKKILPETLAGGWSGELLNKRKNGEEFAIHLSTSLITDDNGKPIAFAGVAVDITEQKMRELELNQARLQAEQAARLKTNFFTNISHELRTPLVGILGFAEILRDKVKNPDLSEMADTIFSSGKRLMETLNSVLDLSTVETDKLDLRLTELNLYNFVEDNIKLFEPIATKKGLELVVKYTNKNIYASVDEHLLYQILNNLINNAIKYTESGKITIETKLIDEKSKFAAIIVSDTGIGIKKENLKNIFEEFSQASGGLSRKFSGTGLGLTITKKFVELMSGEIKAESKFGEGSSFTIMFPLIKESSVESDNPDKILIQEKDSRQKQNLLPQILMVDDDSTSRDIIRMFLKNIYKIDFAQSGEEALQMIEKKSYKIVLMDINLGKGLSGIETTQRIRKISKYKETPIVAITAFAMAGEKEEILRSGCTHYLAKPFLKKGLVNLLESILS
jgi:PAS domain S-box-containing protein